MAAAAERVGRRGSCLRSWLQDRRGNGSSAATCQAGPLSSTDGRRRGTLCCMVMAQSRTDARLCCYLGPVCACMMLTVEDGECAAVTPSLRQTLVCGQVSRRHGTVAVGTGLCRGGTLRTAEGEAVHRGASIACCGDQY